MTFDEKTGWFEFSTGRSIHGYSDYLSISNDFLPKYGYDGDFFLAMNKDEEYGQLTPEEVIEIADYAIALWQKAKEKAQNGFVPDYDKWVRPSNTAETQAPS